MDVTQRVRIIEDSQKLVANSKKLETRLSRLDLLKEHLRALTEYERKDIPTITPAPSYLLEHCDSERDEIIVDAISSDLQTASDKANAITSFKTKVNLFTKVLMKLQEHKRALAQDPDALNSLEQKVRRLIHQNQLSQFLEEAQKAEFKGQAKKAIDKYQEALYFLKTDEIDDSLQAQEIGKIEAKIGSLQGDGC